MAMLPAVKAAIARVDKDQPLTRIRTMEEVAVEATAQPRFRAEIVGLFAMLALALAAVGIFGVLAFSVGQRAREFGIRLALGARSVDVLQLVLWGALRMTAAGVAIGLLAAALLTRLLGTLLFAVQPNDPVTFVGDRCGAWHVRAAGVRATGVARDTGRSGDHPPSGILCGFRLALRSELRGEIVEIGRGKID